MITAVLNQVSKTYDQKNWALKEVSFSLHQGECLSLLGPNGAGKSTLCEIMEGLELPTKGSVEILGLTYQKNRKIILERIGVQLQETSLYKKFSVEETLNLFASFYPRPLPIKHVLEWVRLLGKEKSWVGALSGGERQKLYLGCALIHDPEILFLDEPTTGLDVHSRNALWDVIKELKTRGKSILLTTHSMEESEVLSDRIAILNEGRLLALGSKKEIAQSMKMQGDVLSFTLSPQPSKEEFDQFFCDLFPATPYPMSQERFQVPTRQGSKLVYELSKRCMSHGFSISFLELKSRSLEELFLQMFQTEKDRRI